MGLFDSLDYEKMMNDLREIWGADDRMTGMIPDTYGDPSATDSYLMRAIDGTNAFASRAWNGMPRTGDIIRYHNELGRGLLYGSPSYPANDGYTGDSFGEGYTPSVFSPYMTEDGAGRFGLDDPTSPNRMSINRMASDGAEWVRDNNDELVELFNRGVSLADDNETFMDRQTYLDDGTIGSEEPARHYKLEGGGELVRGVGYGAINTADSILGLVADEDDLIRRPTQSMMRALAYEPTGDETIDMPLATVHSLGEGVGETIATGGVTGGVGSGIKRLAPYIPRDLIAKAPMGLRDSIPYRMQNRLDKIPHLDDFLHTKLGEHILDFTADGIVNTAMIRQLAAKENWSSEEFEEAMVAATALSTLGLGIATRPKAKPAWEDPNWKQPGYVFVKNPFGKRYDEIAAEAGPQLRYDGWMDKKTGKWRYTKPLKVLHDKKTKSPLYEERKQYEFIPTEKTKPNKRAFLQKGNPIMPGVSVYPPKLYATKGKFRKDGGRIRSATWQREFDQDNERPIPDFENEELKVDVANSLTTRDKAKLKEQGKEAVLRPKVEPFMPNVPLMPSDTLIMEKELERVFGKHAILEETATNKYHVTLPNGVELNVQSYHEIPMPKHHSRQIVKRYGFPNRTAFSLKGNLSSVDSYALIQLRDLRDSDTLQHQAIHLAMKTVTTRKEKETLRKLFGPREEDQVAGVMQAIREERARQGAHPNTFMNKILRRIEEFGGYVNDFVKNVPTALAKRDWSYLAGKTPNETLRDYAKSFVDGSVWGHDMAPVMREFVDSHREHIAEAIAKENSRWFSERHGLTLYDHSPSIFSLIGKSEQPLIIDNNIFNKILLEKHGAEISPDHLARVPREMEHPVLIIKADWNPNEATKRDDNAYNFLLEMTDNFGSNIYVPIGLDYSSNTGRTNKIKSIYGFNRMASKMKGKPKFDIDKFLQMIQSDKLAYIDPQKALAIVAKHRPQDYEKVRDYLYRELPDMIFTPEKFRRWRQRRGVKPEMEQEEYFERGH